MIDIRELNWSLLRSFLAVIDAGSLLGAAKLCGSYQPTMSRQIGELEAQLGVPLFERTGRGLVPTAAALAILPAARAMAQSAGDIRDALGATSLTGGTVRVTCSLVAATYLLPPILVEFHKAAPAIQVELVSTNEISSLHRRDADIALRFMRPDQETLIARKLGEVTMGAYAARAYLGRRPPPESIHELTRHTLVGLDRDASQLMAVREAGLALERKGIAFRTDDQVALIELIARGAGIGFMPQYVAAQLKGLRQVLRDVPMPRLPGWLVVHREIASNPAIRSLYDHLASAIPGVLAHA